MNNSSHDIKIKIAPHNDSILFTDNGLTFQVLLGDTQTQNNVSDGFVGASTQAYKRVYPPIAKALKEGECVEITYSDFDSV